MIERIETSPTPMAPVLGGPLLAALGAAGGVRALADGVRLSEAAVRRLGARWL